MKIENIKIEIEKKEDNNIFELKFNGLYEDIRYSYDIQDIAVAILNEDAEALFNCSEEFKGLFIAEKAMNEFGIDIVKTLEYSLPMSEIRLYCEDFDKKEASMTMTTVIKNVSWKTLDLSFEDVYNRKKVIRTIVQSCLNDYMCNSSQVPFNRYVFEQWKEQEEKGEL